MSFNNSNNCSCLWLIIILILLFCCCGFGCSTEGSGHCGHGSDGCNCC
ncbi:MAG: hypothetical protein PUC45_06510 [Oscillospiraceae bacterium]|nr:hypothetical protein [Oscillospiraceae bacterium]